MERLTKRSKNSDMVWFKDAENDDMRLEPCEMSSHHNRMAIAKLAAYEDAEEQGRVLPCTVGDVVYIITKQNISKQRIQKIEIDSFGCIFSTKHRKFSLSYFGNNVFLNREEAKAKLKEMEEKYDLAIEFTK